jgi:hypothetical protein
MGDFSSGRISPQAIEVEVWNHHVMDDVDINYMERLSIFTWYLLSAFSKLLFTPYVP